MTSAQLTGGQWVGPAVRAQGSGQDGYVGFYYWNNGSPVLMLFKRSGGGWAQLGSTYNSGPLAAGTTLELDGGGSTISFLVNGTQVISASDSSITGGAPGIMANGAAEAGSWSGGDAADLHDRRALFRGFPGRWSCRITAVTISASAATARSRSLPRWPPGPPTT